MKSMKEKKNDKWKNQRGFTLIEMVVVLAVIAILAAVVAPRGVKVYEDAQLSSVVTAIKSLQTGVLQYTVKQGAFPASEAVLISTGAIDAAPSSTIKVGTASSVATKVGNVSGGGATADGYDLDGDGTVDTLATETVMELTITAVSDADARKLSLLIDGTANTPAINIADVKGRVEYPIIAAGATGTVVIYVDRK